MADSDNSTTLPFVTLAREREDAGLADKFASVRELRAGEGIDLSRNDGRSRNDKALACARDIMASVGREAPCDAADTATISASDPAALARTLRARFEVTAVTVAAWCALLAHCEGSDASYQTWKQVFARLHEGTAPG